MRSTFEGEGESVGGSGWEELGDDGAHYDVIGAIQYLERAGADRISIVGASFGGWAAARAAVQSDSERLDAIVLLAASPIENPEDLPGRKLYITARADFNGSGRFRLREIRDQYFRSTEPRELLVVSGSAHAQFLFDTAEGPGMLEAIVRFLTESNSS